MGGDTVVRDGEALQREESFLRALVEYSRDQGTETGGIARLDPSVLRRSSSVVEGCCVPESVRKLIRKSPPGTGNRAEEPAAWGTTQADRVGVLGGAGRSDFFGTTTRVVSRPPSTASDTRVSLDRPPAPAGSYHVRRQ